ncbi:MAG: hypothetical protein HY360_18735, partial [Verrucomicrobia bacterium]|nr:hypothetical protein [Verrucomicrobiota bacterium]
SGNPVGAVANRDTRSRGAGRSPAAADSYTEGKRIGSAIQHLLDAKDEPSDDQIVEAILDANGQVIADSKGQGLLLIIDELGKFLEFAALHPQRQDVFLLQRLAETASRSGDEPLFVVCLLHQGFNAYTDHLNQSAQREWEKIAGRFEEIIFNQPVEQIAHLVASALNVRIAQIPKPQVAGLRQAMAQTIELGWFGSAQRQQLMNLAARLYPLHPTEREEQFLKAA